MKCSLLKSTFLSAADINAFIELHIVASTSISSGMLFQARATDCKPRLRIDNPFNTISVCVIGCCSEVINI